MTLRTALWGNQTPFQLWSPGVVSEWVPCQRAASRKVGGGHTFLCWWFTVGVSWWTCCSVDAPGVGKLGASPCPPPRGPGLPSSPSAASLLAGRGGGVLSSLRCMCFGVGHEAATCPHGCQQICGRVCWWMERGDPNHTLPPTVSLQFKGIPFEMTA